MATKTKDKPEETAIAKVENNRFAVLLPGSDANEALSANLGAGETIGVSDLTVVKTPTGGATKWTVEDITGDQTVDEIEGVMVYYGPYGVLWSSEESVEGQPPFMVTSDLRIGHRIGDDYGDLDEKAIEACRLDDGTYDWQKLPYNKYGSGKGKGKRCKEQRYIAILRDGDTLPLLFRVGPGSLRSVTSFIKKLPVPYFRTVVSLSLSKEKNGAGQAYSQIKMRLVETLPAETGAAVKNLYSESLAAAVADIGQRAPQHAEDDLE